jgi:precorrin-6B C5,15-methyltransferase / cobalt-precorrin-6B C5,C15-methyltransferase
VNGSTLVVIGIGHDGPQGLSPEARGHVESAQVLAGGRRQLDFFPRWQGEKLLLGSDVAGFVGTLQGKYKQEKTVVLASGDPLFFGIGRALLEAIPREDLVFLPQVSSVQLAFARVKETWHDARVVSLHGRPMDALVAAIAAREPKIAVLTDARNHPAAIAEFLLRAGVGDQYALWVCENLGGADERISRHDPAGMVDASFSPLNVVILLRGAGAPIVVADDLPLLGIPEASLLHQAGPRGMITRREVRLLALCYLELRPGEVLWDVGAGSGSVSLEAARLSPQLQIFAIERDAAAFARLKDNVEQLGAATVRTICAEAPEGLAGLPAPDAVFIGGSGGRLAEIIETAMQRLKLGGRLVLNCITLESFCRGWERLCDLKLDPEATSVQLAHSRPLGRLHNLEPDNPIFILRARKR